MKKSPTASVLDTLACRKPTRAQAEEAVRTLLAWAGDDPSRPELRDTPRRVVEAYQEYFSGYRGEPESELAATLEHATQYRDIVLLKEIAFESHCEHHIAPFVGVAHVAYVPGDQIVGLSKIARIVEIFARRLQTQERLTCEIAQSLMEGLAPQGVAVMLRAEHQCMSMRGVRQRGVPTITNRFLGCFDTDAAWRDRFFTLVRDAQ